MSFWVLLLRIAILVLSFLAGWGGNQHYQYHYKKLPLIARPCKCDCKDCKCSRSYLPLLRKEGCDNCLSMTQAELDQILAENPYGVLYAPSVDDGSLPPEHGWNRPTLEEREKAEAETGLLP